MFPWFFFHLFDSDDSDLDDFSFADSDDDSAASSESYWSDDVAREVDHFQKREVKDPVILAMLEQDVASLIKLCNGPYKWYKYIQPETGNSLLHISVLYGCERVFQRLLSIKSFPIDHKNEIGQTALYICFDRVNDKYDSFACELIRKGASVEGICREEERTLLHLTIEKCLVKTSKLLMEKGYDVNVMCCEGSTPLWLCLDSCIYEEQGDEMATALLIHGADANLTQDLQQYNLFEAAVRCSSERLQETLFLYMMDKHTSMDVDLETLLLLAERRSPLFQGTIQCVKAVLVEDSVSSCQLIFSIDVTYLDSLVKTCPEAIQEVLIQSQPFEYERHEFVPGQFLDNISFLLESDLKEDAISFISTFSKKSCLEFWVSKEVEESVVVEQVCFFLSYGFKLNEYDVKRFYTRYGYNELLRIVLHTDIEANHSTSFIDDHSPRLPFVRLLLDPNYDLQQILEKCNCFSFKDLSQLMYHFAHPELRRLGHFAEQLDIVDITKEQPRVPLLVELARNVFRKSCGKMFSLSKSSEFYALVNNLPIAPLHKRILTLEEKLYY